MNNPQAFPRAGYDGPDSGDSSVDGMTLRDYFAAAALTGFCASVPVPSKDYYSVAAGCYLLADEMLKEREKTL